MPSTEPWGTPDIELGVLDFLPFTSSCANLSVRKQSNHSPILPLISNDFSVRNMIPWSHLIKVIEKSRYIVSSLTPCKLVFIKWKVREICTKFICSAILPTNYFPRIWEQARSWSSFSPGPPASEPGCRYKRLATSAVSTVSVRHRRHELHHQIYTGSPNNRLPNYQRLVTKSPSYISMPKKTLPNQSLEKLNPT